MEKEQFFKKVNGKLVFVGICSAGINNSVGTAKTHERIARHFYQGDGWPQGKPPVSAIPENIFAEIKGS